jgi:hypothetical protein
VDSGRQAVLDGVTQNGADPCFSVDHPSIPIDL